MDKIEEGVEHKQRISNSDRDEEHAKTDELEFDLRLHVRTVTAFYSYG